MSALQLYRIMPDDVLERAIAELERLASQPSFNFLPPAERAGILDAYASAISEVERRAT